MSRVRCQATVDVLRQGVPGLSRSSYRVTVNGSTLVAILPTRVYDVEAMTQDVAANGCLKLYEQEFDPPVVIPERRLIH